MNNKETLLTENSFARIERMVLKKCNTQKSYENVMHLIKDVFYVPKRLVCIEAKDLIDLFQDGGAIQSLDISIKAEKADRIDELIKLIREKTADGQHINNILVYFFFPEEHPLLMGELETFSECIKSFSDGSMIKWGVATHLRKDFRTIVLLQ